MRCGTRARRSAPDGWTTTQICDASVLPVGEDRPKSPTGPWPPPPGSVGLFATGAHRTRELQERRSMKTDNEIRRDVEMALGLEPGIDERRIALSVLNGIVGQGRPRVAHLD